MGGMPLYNEITWLIFFINTFLYSPATNYFPIEDIKSNTTEEQ